MKHFLRLVGICLPINPGFHVIPASLDDLRKKAEAGEAEAQNILGLMYTNGNGFRRPKDATEAVKWYRIAADQKLIHPPGPAAWNEAVKWYRMAADQGLAVAQVNLGWMYANGKGVPKDSAEAARWYRMAANQGLAYAQGNLGWMYANGEGVPNDAAEAVKWYRMAADQGHAEAQNNLAWMCDNGNGVPKDSAEAVKWYRMAANQGLAVAQFNLGAMYANGKGVPKDAAEAVRWYRMAIQLDDVAQRNLGWVYANGDGVPTGRWYSGEICSWCRTEEMKWLGKAANQGHAEAQYELGSRYKTGYGVHNATEAVRWLGKAANQGHAKAQCELGSMYEIGYGVPEDSSEAVKWYRMAADQWADANAQYSLGLFYANGKGVPEDSSEAVRWLGKAANQGHAEAQYELGSMYANGYGVPKDSAEAVRWYRKAAVKGHSDAENILGLIHFNGEGVPKDAAEVMKWYRMAANQWDAGAQGNLGWIYANRDKVPEDAAEAVRWLGKAADHGFAGAQYNLGVKYANGDGVPKDYIEAYNWVNLAAAAGVEQAVGLRPVLEDQMTPEEIEDADSRIYLYTPFEQARIPLLKYCEPVGKGVIGYSSSILDSEFMIYGGDSAQKRFNDYIKNKCFIIYDFLTYSEISAVKRRWPNSKTFIIYDVTGSEITRIIVHNEAVALIEALTAPPRGGRFAAADVPALAHLGRRVVWAKEFYISTGGPSAMKQAWWMLQILLALSALFLIASLFRR